jgi:nucleotide-binding universal stress UspA family protein
MNSEAAMKVLFAYDGSEASEAALLDLPRAGIPTGSTVVVMTVDRAGDPWIDFDVTSLTQHHTRPVETGRMSKRGADAIRRLMPGVSVASRSALGSVADTIVSEATVLGTDLIVVGSGAEGFFSRLHLGSVSAGVVEHARCSVRVGRDRRHWNDEHPVRIIAGIDGSAESRFTIDHLGRREFPVGSEIWLVTALDGSHPDRALERERVETEIGHRMHGIVLAGQGRIVRSLVRKGDAAAVLLSAAEELHADTIVIGACRLGAFLRMLLGSTARAVVDRAECSVDIIRPSHDDLRSLA